VFARRPCSLQFLKKTDQQLQEGRGSLFSKPGETRRGGVGSGGKGRVSARRPSPLPFEDRPAVAGQTSRCRMDQLPLSLRSQISS
jgi:hypothetical protein